MWVGVAVFCTPSIQELEGSLCSVHWGASSSSWLDTKVPRFFLSEDKELKAHWRKEQAPLWPCLLWSWQRGNGTNGLKFQPYSDPLSSLCPHSLEPECWVGPNWHPHTHTWDFPEMETPRTLVSYLHGQLPPTAWDQFSFRWIPLSASSPPDHRST